jgi:hypothetical protein
VYDQVIRRGSQQFVLEPRCKKDEAETSDNSHVVGASYFDPQSHMPADLGSRQQVWKYAGYTGKQVAEEIAEHWYRNSLFILDVENELLAKFLTTDVWEQDIVPAECIRHLRLNLKPKDTTEVDTEKTLNLLKTLHKNTKFTFNLNWRDSNFPYRFPPLSQFVKKLDESSLRQLVVSLRAAGFKKITVRQGHCRISACYGYYHCHAHPECLFDITHLFDQDATTFGKVFNIVRLHMIRVYRSYTNTC